MKTRLLLFAVLLLLVLRPDCFSQLVADAGNDTIACAADSPELTIGGKPTANGGVEPYRYTWSGSFEYAGRTYTASDVLDDTTVANPVLLEGAIPDSIRLVVLVRDAEGQESSDAIRVGLSRFQVCLADCRSDIHPGDSVQLGHCIDGGIPPWAFLWEPAGTLSDETAESPWAKPAETTTYHLRITDSNGCQITSSCTVHLIPAGVHVREGHPALELSLDPIAGILELNIDREEIPNSTFEIINLSGRVVHTTPVEGNRQRIRITHLDRGVYVYRWIAGTETLASGKILL